MNTMALRKQFYRLVDLYETGVCVNNEWYSVGLLPPADDVIKLKAIGRKLARIARKLKIEWDE